MRSARRRDLKSVWCECFGEFGLTDAYNEEESRSAIKGLHEVLGSDGFGAKMNFPGENEKLREVEIHKIFGRHIK